MIGMAYAYYYVFYQECDENHDRNFVHTFNQYLKGTLNYDDSIHVQCIKEHFKAKKCPSDKCPELWLVAIL